MSDNISDGNSRLAVIVEIVHYVTPAILTVGSVSNFVPVYLAYQRARNNKQHYDEPGNGKIPADASQFYRTLLSINPPRVSSISLGVGLSSIFLALFFVLRIWKVGLTFKTSTFGLLFIPATAFANGLVGFIVFKSGLNWGCHRITYTPDQTGGREEGAAKDACGAWWSSALGMEVLAFFWLVFMMSNSIVFACLYKKRLANPKRTNTIELNNSGSGNQVVGNNDVSSGNPVVENNNASDPPPPYPAGK